MRKSRRERKYYDRAVARFGRIPDVEILNWIDQAGSGMARALQDYRRDPDTLGSLEEAREGAEAIMAGIDVLTGRRG